MTQFNPGDLVQVLCSSREEIIKTYNYFLVLDSNDIPEHLSLQGDPEVFISFVWIHVNRPNRIEYKGARDAYRNLKKWTLNLWIEEGIWTIYKSNRNKQP